MTKTRQKLTLKEQNISNEALLSAAQNGLLGVVKALITSEVEINVNVNATNTNGVTALVFMASQGCVEIVNLLLVKGADIDATNKHGDAALTASTFSALTASACFDHLEVVNLLLEKGVDIEAKDYHGNTALIMAEGRAKKGNANAIKIVKSIKSASLADDILTGTNKFAFKSPEEKHDIDLDLVKARCKFRIQKIVEENISNNIIKNIESNDYLQKEDKAELIAYNQEVTFKLAQPALDFININLSEDTISTIPSSILLEGFGLMIIDELIASRAIELPLSGKETEAALLELWDID